MECKIVRVHEGAYVKANEYVTPCMHMCCSQFCIRFAWLLACLCMRRLIQLHLQRNFLTSAIIAHKTTRSRRNFFSRIQFLEPNIRSTAVAHTIFQ